MDSESKALIFRVYYHEVDFRDPQSIERYAKHLEGMTFQDVLDLGIYPSDPDAERGGDDADGASDTDTDIDLGDGDVRGAKGGAGYSSSSRKGGLGNLIEERYFGYRANSDEHPDFPEAGLELKCTCYDCRKSGRIAAGERLVITMVHYDRAVQEDLYESPVWKKLSSLLLIVYERDKSLERYDQTIHYVTLFSPPERDLKVIEEDYKRIAQLVRQGRADEISEGMTNYLGACTKGASEKTMWVTQFYKPYRKAKRRAFCLKQGYMDYVLHKYVIGDEEVAEPIVKDLGELGEKTLERYVVDTVKRYVGKTDKELCAEFGIPYTNNKAQWTTITYRMLGVHGGRAEEFEKAGISVRSIRARHGKSAVTESLSLDPFEFADLMAEPCWEESALNAFLEGTRFFFVVFEEGATKGDPCTLIGATFWSMSSEIIDCQARQCWEETRESVERGADLRLSWTSGGKPIIRNGLPGMRDNPYVHVRNHASESYYRAKGMPELGDNPRFGSMLPNGDVMTKQSFWIGHKVLELIVTKIRFDSSKDGAK